MISRSSDVSLVAFENMLLEENPESHVFLEMLEIIDPRSTNPHFYFFPTLVSKKSSFLRQMDLLDTDDFCDARYFMGIGYKK